MGDQDRIEGTIYTAVDNSTIKAQLDSGNINLCTTLVTNMSGTSNPFANFFNNSSFNANIGFWDVSNVTNMDGMFFGASDFNQDLSQWDVSQVDNMGSLFKNATSFNQDISGWDTGSVTKMLDLFALASSFNQDIVDGTLPRRLAWMECSERRYFQSRFIGMVCSKYWISTR